MTIMGDLDFVVIDFETIGLGSGALPVEIGMVRVSLQATSTYGNTGAATVGGLIEVVTIDRVNGVLWRRGLSV